MIVGGMHCSYSIVNPSCLSCDGKTCPYVSTMSPESLQLTQLDP